MELIHVWFCCNIVKTVLQLGGSWLWPHFCIRKNSSWFLNFFRFCKRNTSLPYSSKREKMKLATVVCFFPPSLQTRLPAKHQASVPLLDVVGSEEPFLLLKEATQYRGWIFLTMFLAFHVSRSESHHRWLSNCFWGVGKWKQKCGNAWKKHQQSNRKHRIEKQ